MGSSGGSLFPEKDRARSIKEYRETLREDIQALQRDPHKLTIDLLENIGKHLQEIYKLLNESAMPALISFSIRYPLLLETEGAYQLLKALMEFIKNSGDVSLLGLNGVSSEKVYEDSLILTKRLQSIEKYLYNIPPFL